MLMSSGCQRFCLKSMSLSPNCQIGAKLVSMLAFLKGKFLETVLVIVFGYFWIFDKSGKFMQKSQNFIQRFSF